MVKQRRSCEEWIDYLTPLARRVKQRKSNNQPTAKNVAKLTRGKYSAQAVRMAIVHHKIDHKEVEMVRKKKKKAKKKKKKKVAKKADDKAAAVQSESTEVVPGETATDSPSTEPG